MKITLAGGLWSNAEDEILKAAVMKYGKNQWGRIASLLVKKSPKQCKARWYEWLDPSIKKTEWTREEDEKLLHLAKLMPQQWRSIAPIVGRTAHQCLERYEKLIDNASAQQQDASSSDQQQQQQSNPRKLKPGEIDPAPETKPAKPDAVDMDEDEKEMLNEARARLANTQGKKAKRKARERQLEEARRLANLQKKRELKAAGLEGAINRRKHRGGIDYGIEIPFKKDPPKGFFDTTEEELREKEKSQGEFKPTTIQELEGVKRKDIEKSVMESKTKQQEMQERNDAPAAIAQAEQANDVDMSQRRGKLTLPAPQVSEREMNDIAKLGKRGGIYGSSDASASDSTAGLVANYSASETPAPTTPRTPKEERDTVLQEAENLSKLQSGETPLAGGENPDLHPSDFSGVTPRRSHPRTPNVNASQGTVQQTPGETPRSAASSPASQRGSQQGRTPFRDSFGINAPDSQALLGSKRKRKEHQSDLKTGFASLPKPKQEYQKVMPESVPGEPAAAEPISEDAEEQERRLREEEQKREEAEWRKQSSAVQRQLPRPAAGAPMWPDTQHSDAALREAQELVAEEASLLVKYDDINHPPYNKRKRMHGSQHRQAPHMSRIDDEQLDAAHHLLDEETSADPSSIEPISVEEVSAAREECVLDRQQGECKRASQLSKDELAKHQAAEFDALKKQMEGACKKTGKQENKVSLLLSGLKKRSGEVKKELEDTMSGAEESERKLEAFRALKAREDAAASERMQSLQDELKKVQATEKQLQKRYADLQDHLR